MTVVIPKIIASTVMNNERGSSGSPHRIGMNHFLDGSTGIKDSASNAGSVRRLRANTMMKQTKVSVTDLRDIKKSLFTSNAANSRKASVDVSRNANINLTEHHTNQMSA